jgi:hypothetical protein
MELRDIVYLHFFGRTVCLLGTALNQNVSLPAFCVRLPGCVWASRPYFAIH